MTSALPQPAPAEDVPHYAMGWDVGGWNCDHNSASRDALVILDSAGHPCGQPWRGNLREAINTAPDAAAWLAALFALCGASVPAMPWRCTLGVDTPLGFADAFVRLVTRQGAVARIGGSADNPYLYRETERFLIRHGIQPLSPVKDMIGSQATKGMHVLARFAPCPAGCGAWCDPGGMLTVMEAYPSPCRRSALVTAQLAGYDSVALDHADKRDALLCALLARLHAQDRMRLACPPVAVPESEGWIWVPADALDAAPNPAMT